MPLGQEIINLIRKDFPDEAVQAKKVFRDGKTGEDRVFTGFKPQYIIERLNDSFGHEGWDFEIVKLGMDNDSAWCHGKLTIFVSKEDQDAINGPLIRKIMTVKEQIGSCEYKKGISYGDALKGATTNCIEKCASLLDIGHKAYKGLVALPEGYNMETGITGEVTDESRADKVKEDRVKELKTLCKASEIGNEGFKVLMKTVLKKEKDPKELTVEEVEALIKHLRDHGAPF